MPNTALNRHGADLDQAPEAETPVQAAAVPSLGDIEVEAALLAARAAAFGLFGLKLDHRPEADWTDLGAEAAYLDGGPAPAPANESAPVLEAETVEASAVTVEEMQVEAIEPVQEAPAEIQVEPTPITEGELEETVETVLVELRAVLEQAEQTEAVIETLPALAAPKQTLPALATQTLPSRAMLPPIRARGLRVPPALAMRFMQGLDWIVTLAAAQFAALWSNGHGLAALSVAQAVIFFAAAGALKVGLWLTDLYRTPPAKLRAEHGAGGLALGVVAGLGIAAFFAPDARSAAALSATVTLAALLLAGAHAAFAVWMHALHKRGAFSETIVLVGATEAAERLMRRAAERGDARIVAVVDDRISRAPFAIAGVPVTGSIDDLLRWDGLPHVDRIVVTVTQKAEQRVRGMVEKLRRAPNRIDLLLDYDTISVRGRKLDRLTGAAMACVSGRPHNIARALMKRAQDVVIGALLTVVFAPVMAAIAVAVKLDSKGPALYRQQRHGFNNRIITVLKFRTMRHDPGAPLRQVEANDPRITRIGAFLRSTSLDELPQLINVLAGDMSLVGPRPHAVGMRAADRDLSHIVSEYAHRHRVKPGITGWAQVNGSRGPIDTPSAVRERTKLDLDYVSRASLWFDLAILARTVPILFGDTKSTR